MMVVFTRVVVVGNLNIITTTVDAWWQYDYCTWFWVTCMCLSPKQYSSLYIPPVSKQMWQCSMSITRPLYGGYVGCFPKMVAILLHHLRSIMVWLVAANMCFFQYSWSIYNVVAPGGHSHWGWWMHIVHGYQQYQCTNCLQHLYAVQ